MQGMTREEKQIVCDNIFEYICGQLQEWVDAEIFNKTSLEQLGELYYDKILNNVEQASLELVNAVVKTIAPKDSSFEEQEGYYRALCRILGIIKLPSDLLLDVEKEYDELFVQKYAVVMQKYQQEISRINSKLYSLKSQSNEIKRAKPSYMFMRDLATDETQLLEIYSECNELRSRKSMLEFAMEYLNSRLMDFCNMQDITSVSVAKMRKALELSKTDVYGADFSFSSYKEYLEIVEDDIDRDYALFFKVKLYVIIENARKSYRYSTYTKSDDEALEEYETYLNKIPPIDTMNSYKKNNLEHYDEVLEKLIVDFELMDGMQKGLESSVCLRERKGILLKAVELYNQGEYEIFNNIIPIQIEGMFADYLRDTTTFRRFSKMDIYADAVLKDKIRYLHEIKSDIYPEAVEYFMYYFNDMIRNRIAHGRYSGSNGESIQDKVFSKELILDMSMLVHMLTRKSETEKMYRFIHGYKEYYESRIRTSEHPCFGALFNDMIGGKLIADYDTMDKYRPIQVAYWLVNPYYERIYGQVEDKTDLLELRAELLSEEFWEYVLEQLNLVITEGFDYKHINMEFKSVVNGLFKCDVSNDVKKLLGQVNAALVKIQSL